MSPTSRPPLSPPGGQTLSEPTNPAGRYAQAIVRTMPQPVLILTQELQVEFANPAFYRTSSLPSSETVGCSLSDLGHGSWNSPALHHLLTKVSGSQRDLQDYRVEHHGEALGQRTFLLNATRLETRETGEAERILLAFSDITEAERPRAVRFSPVSEARK